jgi:hypothetical protein
MMRRRQASERGAALILAIMMLVAMTGLGVLAVTASRMEVIVAGNFRTMTQAQYVAEAGLIAVSQEIQNDPARFASSAKKDRPDAIAPDEWLTWDLDYFGVNTVFILEDDSPRNRSMGFDSRPLDFRVWVENVQDVPACPGASTSSGCCLRVGLVSEGRVGIFDEDGMPLDGTNAARRRVRAEYAVPYPCAT